MLMFTLAISCLTMSNLPWFMDLTFQVPMQYCSLQTLLSPPNTSTIKCFFHFGPATSFFLELLVIVFHSSLVAYWTPSNLGGSSSSIVCVCVLFTQSCLTLYKPMDCSSPASSVYGILWARIQQWVAIPFSSESSWLRNQTQVSWISGRFFTIWAIGGSLWYHIFLPFHTIHVVLVARILERVCQSLLQ